jgi:hypothetical protein
VRPRRARTVALVVLVALAATGATVLWPWTYPTVIHAKARILGPGLVYGPLAADDGRWDSVLAGVRSADPLWLRVAVDLRPVLDTHPGEEMVAAVSGVLDKNPAGAIAILLPAYGVGVVCGQDDEGDVIAHETAEKRLRLLQRLPQDQIDRLRIEECVRTVASHLDTTKRRD